MARPPATVLDQVTRWLSAVIVSPPLGELTATQGWSREFVPSPMSHTIVLLRMSARFPGLSVHAEGPPFQLIPVYSKKKLTTLLRRFFQVQEPGSPVPFARGDSHRTAVSSGVGLSHT